MIFVSFLFLFFFEQTRANEESRWECHHRDGWPCETLRRKRAWLKDIRESEKKEKENENENEKGVETNDVAGGEEVEDARKHTQSVQQEKARPVDDIYASVDDEDCPIPSFSRVPASPSSASASPRPKPLTHSNSTFMNFPDFVPANPDNNDDDDEDGPPIPFFEDEKRSLPSSPLVSPCSPQPADIDETVEELFGPTSPHVCFILYRPHLQNNRNEKKKKTHTHREENDLKSRTRRRRKKRKKQMQMQRETRS